MYNTETQDTQNYTLFDDMYVSVDSWTNDGRWFMFKGRDFLILTAPEANYDYFVRPEFGDCTGAAWIK